MEHCLPPACDSHQQSAAVEGWLRYLKVDLLVGKGRGMIHVTCTKPDWSCTEIQNLSWIFSGRGELGPGAEFRVGAVRGSYYSWTMEGLLPQASPVQQS